MVRSLLQKLTLLEGPEGTHSPSFFSIPFDNTEYRVRILTIKLLQNSISLFLYLIPAIKGVKLPDKVLHLLKLVEFVDQVKQ